MTEPRASRHSAFESALAELRAGRIERAEVLCDRILHSAPQDPAAHQLAATIAFRRGRLGGAARWASSSLSLRPDHLPTLIIAARVARASGDFAQARVWLDRASRLDPDRKELAFLTCLTLIESGDGKARSVSEDLLLRFPNFVDGWREIGEALRKAGHLETAVLALARAAESCADPIDFARLGVALQTINRPLEAIVAFRRAAHVNLGLNLQNCGDLNAAMDSYRHAMRLRPDTFGRIAQALTSAKKGYLWLNLARLRRSLEAWALTPHAKAEPICAGT